MGLTECFERDQLRRIPPDAKKARQSLETAKVKLAEAKGLSKAGFSSVAVVSAYASMFHSARALLYLDGVQEKSHYCLIAYVRETYTASGKVPPGLVTVMDAFRQARHDVMYGFGEPVVKKSDEVLAIHTADAWIVAVSKLI